MSNRFADYYQAEDITLAKKKLLFRTEFVSTGGKPFTRCPDRDGANHKKCTSLDALESSTHAEAFWSRHNKVGRSDCRYPSTYRNQNFCAERSDEIVRYAGS